MSRVISGATVYIPLAELINLDEEINRLQKEAKSLPLRSNAHRENYRMINLFIVHQNKLSKLKGVNLATGKRS